MPLEKTKAARDGSASRYQRSRDLPRLLPLWPHEIEPVTLSDHARLLARMRRALRIERQRGIAGHWAYDLARHVQLLRAYRAETADYLHKARRARASGVAADEGLFLAPRTKTHLLGKI